MKLVSLYSTIKMMHGPINIRFPCVFCVFCVTGSQMLVLGPVIRTVLIFRLYCCVAR